MFSRRPTPLALGLSLIFALCFANLFAQNKIAEQWRSETLRKAPSFIWVDEKSPVRSLLYESVAFEGKPTQVFAYFATPETLLGKKPSGKKFPALVLVHGGGGTAFREWVEKWAAEGYAAIAMDLSGRDGKGEKLVNAGPGQGHDDKFTKIEKAPLSDVWTYHAVASVLLAHSWLLSRPDIDRDKTGVTGISWGGYLTNLAGAVDHRFKAAVPVYGCGYYDESDVFGEPLNALSEENKKKWMENFDPSAYLPGSRYTRFLFLNGNKDRFYNVVPYHKTYSLVPADRRKVLIIPEMKHSHYHGWEPHEIKYFFDGLFFEKAPLPDVGETKTGGDEISATFSSPVKLHTAEFHYSNDTESPNETRKWSVQRAEIDHENGTISVKLPQEGFRYGFFYIRDNRNVSASGEFVIRD